MKRKNRILSLLLAVTLVLTFTAIFGSTTALAADYDHTKEVSTDDEWLTALLEARSNSGKTYLFNVKGESYIPTTSFYGNMTVVIKPSAKVYLDVGTLENNGTIIIESGGELDSVGNTFDNKSKIIIQKGGTLKASFLVNQNAADIENNGLLHIFPSPSLYSGLKNSTYASIHGSGEIWNDNANSTNEGIINLLPGGSITGSQPIDDSMGSISYSPVVSGTNTLSVSQGAVGVQTVTVALSTSHSTEEITLTATVGGKTAVATKTGDGDVTFSFAAADLNNLAIGSYPIMVSAPATTNNKEIAETYVGTLTVLATDKEIISFALDGNSCIISGTNISLAVPYGTDVTNMTPTITHSGASISPASGIPQDFSAPVTYTVTAADSSTRVYTVTVAVGAQPTYAVTVAGGTGGGNYPQDATVNIIADTPPTGQKFDKWTSSDVGFANESTATTSFVMPAKAVTVTATYKNIPPTPIVKHTITLGASGDGTVSGGGIFDDGSSITVTAIPNAGNSFVNWTENGIVVSKDASYTFVVTADCALTAVFEKDDATKPDPDPPVTPPTTTYSRSSDSSVGSNKADTSPNLKPAVAGRPFTKAEATKLFTAALAAKPEGQATLSFRANNYTSASKDVFAELASLAQKNGVTLTVYFDTVVGKAVTYRVSVNPAPVTTNLDLAAKIVGGKLTLPKFPLPVEIAVKLPQGLTMETLKITQNGTDVTATAKPWLDKNGYVHFTTTGGEIVLGK